MVLSGAVRSKYPIHGVSMADLGAIGSDIHGEAIPVVFPTGGSTDASVQPRGTVDIGTQVVALPFRQNWKTLSGIVTSDGNPASRTVYAIHRSTKVLHATGASNGAGVFSLKVPFAGDHYTIFAEGVSGENVVGADFVLPV